MKKTIRSFSSFIVAAMMVAAMNFIFTSQAGAQIPQNAQYTILPSGLPSALPIGDELTFRSFIVSTNGNIVKPFVPATKGFFTQFGYYDTNKVYQTCYKYCQTNGFESYDDYMQIMVKEGLALLHELTQRGYCPETNEIQLMDEIDYTYSDSGTSFSGLYFETSLGSLRDINSSLFEAAMSLTNLPVHECCILPMPGLTAIRIDVQTPVPSWYEWNSGISTNFSDSWKLYSQIKDADRSCLNYLALSHWYSIGKYRARIKLTVGGKSATYTEFGEPIAPPKLEMLSATALQIVAPRGGSITVWLSPDQKTWAPYTNFTSSTSTTSVISVNPSYPVLFFKASVK